MSSGMKPTDGDGLPPKTAASAHGIESPCGNPCGNVSAACVPPNNNKQQEMSGVASIGVDAAPASASASVSNISASCAGSNDGALQEVLRLECPVCMQRILPPFVMCKNSHFVCERCLPEVKPSQGCPSCRGPLPDIRVRLLEQMADKLEYPCKFLENGCQGIFHYTRLKDHERDCLFRSVECPCPGVPCRWEGRSMDELMPHFESAHSSIVKAQGVNMTFVGDHILESGPVEWAVMQSCLGRHFLFVLRRRRKSASAQLTYDGVVQFMGHKRDAEQFCYRLELSRENKHQLLRWEAAPLSVHEDVEEAFGKSKCLSFEEPTARQFAKYGRLTVDVTIWRKSGSGGS